MNKDVGKQVKKFYRTSKIVLKINLGKMLNDLVLKEEKERPSWMSEGAGRTRNSVNFRQRVESMEAMRRTWDSDQL